jgi:hypothetical protein
LQMKHRSMMEHYLFAFPLHLLPDLCLISPLNCDETPFTTIGFLFLNLLFGLLGFW